MEAASEAAQLEQDQVQETQGSARELADIKALMEFTRAEADTAVSSTAPPCMAMVLASGPIPVLEHMATTPTAANSVSEAYHHTALEDSTQHTAVGMAPVSASARLMASEAAASDHPEVVNAPWPPRGLQLAVQGLVHHPPVPAVSDVWTLLT